MLYWLAISLHLLAATLWLGHMFIWSLIVGPAMKRIEPQETAALLRERSLYGGGLGWYALIVLTATGWFMLYYRGIGLDELLRGDAIAGPQGAVLTAKLSMVLAMIVYQAVFGHRPARVAIYFNMLAAAVVLFASTVLVRGWV